MSLTALSMLFMYKKTKGHVLIVKELFHWHLKDQKDSFTKLSQDGGRFDMCNLNQLTALLEKKAAGIFLKEFHSYSVVLSNYRYGNKWRILRKSHTFHFSGSFCVYACCHYTYSQAWCNMEYFILNKFLCRSFKVCWSRKLL